MPTTALPTPTTAAPTSAHDVSGITYDGNGNITALQRRDKNGTLIDNLTYSYTSGTNRLAALTEAAGASAPTWDAEAGSFTYDANGNALALPAPYSGSLSAYDWRNLPGQWTGPGGQTGTYRYSASGQRVSRTSEAAGTGALTGGPSSTESSKVSAEVGPDTPFIQAAPQTTQAPIAQRSASRTPMTGPVRTAPAQAAPEAARERQDAPPPGQTTIGQPLPTSNTAPTPVTGTEPFAADQQAATAKTEQETEATPERNPPTGAFGSAAEAERLEYVRADVQLEITPWVGADPSGNREVTALIRPAFATPVGAFDPRVPPTINSWTVDTSVRLRDGETFMIGGLVREHQSRMENRVPLLRRIPLIGRLFRNSERSTRKSELVIFITPHVLAESRDGAAAVGLEAYPHLAPHTAEELSRGQVKGAE